MKEIDAKDLEKVAGGFIYGDYNPEALVLLGYTIHGPNDGEGCDAYDPVIKSAPQTCTNCRKALYTKQDRVNWYCTAKK